MLKNYFKSAWRNLVKQRLYSTINLLGLMVGMTCFILITLYVHYELSYDTHHENADRIYRVYQQQKGNDFKGTDLYGVTPAPLASVMEETFPEVEVATNVKAKWDMLSYQDKVLSPRVLYANEKIFDIFSIPIINGVGREALRNPNSILLSESLAEKYFGDESPLEKNLIFDNERSLTVKGIFKDMPKNQHLPFEYIISPENSKQFKRDQREEKWDSNNYLTYVLLSKDTDDQLLESKLSTFDKLTGPAYKDIPFQPVYLLQPIKDIHLTSNINFNPSASADLRLIYLLTSIAFIILLLAAINYTNLATVASIKRSKEVGIRKVMGARKIQLITQLLSESFLLTSISFVLALGLVYFLLPLFSNLIDQPISFDIMGSRWLLIGMLSTALLIGVLSGLYPAFFLSTVSPAKAFKGNFLKNIGQGIGLRNILTIGQFAAAIALTISSVVVYQQLQYIQNKKLGFNRDQMVYVPFWFEEIDKNSEIIRNELLAHPNVKKVAKSTDLPLDSSNQGTVEKWEGNTGEEAFHCYRNYVDYNYLDVFEIELLAGRNFSSAHPTDSTESYILNEAAVVAAGWTPESAIGKGFREGKVIGVVRDFHFQPMDMSIEPLFMMFHNSTSNYGNIAMKISMGNIESTLSHIQQTFKKVAPSLPVNYRFMDESYNQLYESEQRLGRAFNVFTILALLIACIGLFGLVSHSVVRRTKEIGIRKVLGASIDNIVLLISKDFLRLILIAFVIAIPITFYAMSQWLENFAYRIQISWWVFALTGIVVIGIAFLTVSFQSIKAALANPIDSLHNE